MSQLDLGLPFPLPIGYSDLLKSRGVEGLPWRRREIAFQGSTHEQFLVLSADERRVLASGFTVQDAALAASQRLRFLALPVQHFSPHLVGATFRDCVDEAGGVHNEVVSSEGEILGVSASGRKAACMEAEVSVLCRRDISSLSYEEFEVIAFPVAVRRGMGRKDALTLFSGDESQLRRMLGIVFERSPSSRQSGETKSDYIDRVRAGLANACDIGSRDFYSGSVAIPEMNGRLFLVLHQERLSPEMAIRYAYKGEREAAQEVAQACEQSSPRQRA